MKKRDSWLTALFAAASAAYLYPVAVVLINSFKKKAYISRAPFALPTPQTWAGLDNYRRGAALWTALELALGKEELDGFLRSYVEAYRFGRASREDLTQLLTDFTGRDWSALMSDYLDTLMN